MAEYQDSWAVTTTSGTTPLYVTFDSEPKEQEVDIGGDKCHLCGARRKSSEQSTYFHYYKNDSYDREWYSRAVYRCGTTVVNENRTKYDKRGDRDTEKVFEPLVTVGSKCIR